jgi:hypothetical protein
MLPEMLGALSVDVTAGQSDIVQHPIVELAEQVAAPHSLTPYRNLSQQLFQKTR